MSTYVINHKGGYICVNGRYITAFSHGARLGDYRTVQGARSALTRAHKQWVSARNADHYTYLLRYMPGLPPC